MKLKMPFYGALFLFLLIPYNNYAQTFLHNVVVAKEKATAQKKPILMIFSGSDWCKPCIQLRENILTHPDFAAFAKEKLLLLELDFPYKRKNRLSKEQQKHNEQLAEQYNPKGQFPLMLLISGDGEVISKVDFNPDLKVAAYLRILQPKI